MVLSKAALVADYQPDIAVHEQSLDEVPSAVVELLVRHSRLDVRQVSVWAVAASYNHSPRHDMVNVLLLLLILQ